MSIVEEIMVKGVRDIKDHKTISYALQTGAHYIVTGDKDLLILKKYRGVQIATAREFSVLVGKIIKERAA